MEYAKINEHGVIENIIIADAAYIKMLKEKSFYVKTFNDANGEPEKFYNPASIGGTYDKIKKAFIPPKPYTSWVLNEKMTWDAPVKKPALRDGFYLMWDEEQVNWVELEMPVFGHSHA